MLPPIPPYNIERTGENAYRITLAVAGFAESELSVETRESTLTVRGSKEAAAEGREARRALSRHRRSRLRATFPACRPCGRDGRGKREWPAAYRSGAGGSGGSEAADHRDQQGRRQDHRSRQSAFGAGRLNPSCASAGKARASRSGRPFSSIRIEPGGRRSPLLCRSPAADEPEAAGGVVGGALLASWGGSRSSALLDVSRPAWRLTNPVRPGLRAGQEAAEADWRSVAAGLFARNLMFSRSRPLP